MKGIRLFVSLAIFFSLLLSCSNEMTKDATIFKSNTLRKASRYITAILEINTPGYFLKNGLPTGYHFDLLSSYAKSRGLLLKVVPFTTIEAAKSALKTGKADLLAIESNYQLGEDFRRTIPHWKLNFSTISYSDKAISQDSKVYIPNNLFSKNEIQQISDKFKDIVFYDGLNIGILTEYLASDPTAYAIVQSSVAEALKLKYANLVATKFNQTSLASWYVSQKCTFLYDLNSWIAGRRNSDLHPTFYSSYYQNYKVNRCIESGVNISGEFNLSEYDNTVKIFSKKIGWDWLLVSALIYQESQFKPRVESNKGAKGLMQVMPATANLFGYDSEHSPTTNIYIGTKLLERLTKAFAKYPISDEERSKFVLASYNGGIGHILDAMRLTAKFGQNPYVWDNVSTFLKYKKSAAYFNDELVRFGAFYNNETTKFVDEIIERYQNYRALSLSI